MLLLLAALAGPALAGNQYDCTNDDSYPIWGTAGYANTLEALRTNAVTYSASAFAERRLFREIAEGDFGENVGAYGYELNLTYGVSRVPVYSEDAVWGDCPTEYVLATRPVDLQAQDIGVAYRWKNVGAFYAASVAFGNSAQDPYSRVMLWSMAAPIYSIVPLAFAPITGSWQSGTGASAFAQDWVFGAMGDYKGVYGRLGYTNSRGFYGHFEERRSGAFVGFVFKDGFRLLGQGAAGFQRFKGWPEPVGKTSAFVRQLPLTEAVDPDTTDDQPGFIEQLRTGHLYQEDIAGMIDVRLAYAVKPVAEVHEAVLGLHNKGWAAGGVGVHVQGGMTTLPPQYYYGLKGGRYVSARAGLRYGKGLDEPGGGVFEANLWFNDPEQTALYPFAVNAVSFRASIQGGF